MNYLEIFDSTNTYIQQMKNIIDYRLKNSAKSFPYYENHHIIPKSWFKYNGIYNTNIINNSSNLISLLAREHLEIHILLKKYFESIQNYYMQYAMSLCIDRMCKGNKEFIQALEEKSNDKEFFLTEYELNKNELHNLRVRFKPDLAGTKNPAYGKIWIYNDKTKQRKFIDCEKFTEYEVLGWKRGLKFINAKQRTKTIKAFHTTLFINKQFEKQEDIIFPWVNGSITNQTVPIYDPITHEKRRIKISDKLPNNWKYGIDAYKPDWSNGKIRIYNEELKINRIWPKNEPIPPNWKFGMYLSKDMHLQRSEICKKRAKGNTFNKGKIWIYNIQTLENKKIDKSLNIPNGWIKGNSRNLNKRIIHNIETNKNLFIPKEQKLPNGYAEGMGKQKQRKKRSNKS